LFVAKHTHVDFAWVSLIGFLAFICFLKIKLVLHEIEGMRNNVLSAYFPGFASWKHKFCTTETGKLCCEIYFIILMFWTYSHLHSKGEYWPCHWKSSL
jgi:hypothetical protein